MEPQSFDARRPFWRADALAAGISSRRLAGPRFRRIFQPVYISSAVPETEAERVFAALMLHPEGAWISHLSAAAWWGVVVPDTSVVHVSVTQASDRRWRPGLKPHVAPVGTPTLVRAGVRTSSAVRMFVELASMLDLVDLVVAGDSLIRVFGMTAKQLREELSKCTDYWSSAARAAAAFVRDEVDSPMETRLRMLIVLAGLPEPRVNLTIRDEDGRVIVRFDLSYPAVHLAIEYDGRQHVEVVANWERDEERREFLDSIEWRVLKVRAKGIFVEPERTLERIWSTLRQRGMAVPVPHDGWRVHFPGRRRAA